MRSASEAPEADRFIFGRNVLVDVQFRRCPSDGYEKPDDYTGASVTSSFLPFPPVAQQKKLKNTKKGENFFLYAACASPEHLCYQY